jgi:threonine/homoserine/homoserine lactone efflux protein
LLAGGLARWGVQVQSMEMVPLSSILGFALISLLLAVSPGPSWAYVISSTVTGGRAGGWVAVAGNAVGIGVHVIAVALGLSAVLAWSPTIFLLLKMIGGVYLIWLGVKAIYCGWQPLENAGDTPAATPWQVFRGGVLANVLNPKVATVMLAVLPYWVDPALGPVAWQLLLLGSIHVVIASSLLLTLSMLTAVTLRRFDGFPRWLNIVTGIALIAFGGKLAWA